MATEIKHAIRSDDGWASMSAPEQAEYAGYYTTLSAWEAGEQGDLVAADEIRTAVCYDDWPDGLSNNVSITGSTTDATRYMRVTVADGHRHDGTPGTGFWLTAAATCFSVAQGYTRLEWLDVVQTNTASGRHGYSLTGPGCQADNCIGTSASTGSSSYAFNFDNATPSSARSCFAYNSPGRGFRISSAGGATLLNCVASGNGVGFITSSAGAILKNCVAYNNTTNYSGTFSGSSTHNATSSATNNAPGNNSVWGITSADFVDTANNDFHLSAGSVLRGAGTNLYSTFTTDIDGDTWPSSGAWDIGFDYYVSSFPILSSLSVSNITSSGGRLTVN